MRRRAGHPSPASIAIDRSQCVAEAPADTSTLLLAEAVEDGVPLVLSGVAPGVALSAVVVFAPPVAWLKAALVSLTVMVVVFFVSRAVLSVAFAEVFSAL